MAQTPKFYIPDCDLLTQFLPSVRCVTFGTARELLDDHFRTHFPPDTRSKNNAGWNRHCNLATLEHIQQEVDAGNLQPIVGTDHGRIPPTYDGEWFDSATCSSLDLGEVAEAFVLDLQDVQKVKDKTIPFYATRESVALTRTFIERDGRSEFVNQQFALSAFKQFLDRSNDSRHRSMAASWKLLELPSDFNRYQQAYRGDAVVEDSTGKIVICSPVIHGWWSSTTHVHDFLRSLPQRIGSERYILLSILGFKSWSKRRPIAP